MGFRSIGIFVLTVIREEGTYQFEVMQYKMITEKETISIV